MKLAFISVFFFIVLSSASESVFAGRNRSRGANIKSQVSNGQVGGVIDKAAANSGASNKNGTAADTANAGGNNSTSTNASANTAADGDPQTSTSTQFVILWYFIPIVSF